MRNLKFKLGDKVLYEGDQTQIIGIDTSCAYDEGQMPYIVADFDGINHKESHFYIDFLPGLEDFSGWWAEASELTAIEPSTALKPKYSVGDLVRYNGKATYITDVRVNHRHAAPGVSYCILSSNGWTHAPMNRLYKSCSSDFKRFPVGCRRWAVMEGGLEELGSPRVGDIVEFTERYISGTVDEGDVGKITVVNEDAHGTFYDVEMSEGRAYGCSSSRFKILADDADCYPKDYVSPTKCDPAPKEPEETFEIGDLVKTTCKVEDGPENKIPKGAVGTIIGDAESYGFYIKFFNHTTANYGSLVPDDTPGAGVAGGMYVKPKDLKMAPETTGIQPSQIIADEVQWQTYQMPLVDKICDLVATKAMQTPDLQALYQFVCSKRAELGRAHSDADRRELFLALQEKLNDELGIPQVKTF